MTVKLVKYVSRQLKEEKASGIKMAEVNQRCLSQYNAVLMKNLVSKYLGQMVNWSLDNLIRQ